MMILRWCRFLIISFSIISFALLVLASQSIFANDLVPTEKKDFHLFLLVGQSNMAGRGKVAKEDTTPHENVLMLNKAGEWVPAVDPMHFDKPTMVGVGLGKTFGIEYAKAHPGVTVGLIPCAAGGSPISSWSPGGYHSQTKSHPWDDAISRTKLALTSGTLQGILWHQGESDSRGALASAYEDKLHDLVKRFRTELDCPTVPFIVGQLGQFKERPWTPGRKKVDAAHQALTSKVANTAFVRSDDLVHKGDQTHFSAESYRVFGKRYFAAFEKLTAGDKPRE